MQEARADTAPDRRNDPPLAATRAWRAPAAALGVAAAVLLVQWPFRLLSVNLIDEGLVMQLAAEVLDGRRLYSDAVVFAWPGTFYLTALAFWLASPSVEVARAIAAGCFAASAAFAYGTTRWFAGPTGALLAVGAFVAYRVWAYPHWQMLNYSSFAMTFVLAATWLVGRALATGARVPAAAAGVAAAAATLCKQDSGGIATLALLVALALATPRGRRLASAVAFAGGVAAVMGAWVVTLVAAGELRVTLAESVWSPLWGAREFAGYLRRPSLWPLVTQDPTLRANFFSYAPPIVIDLFWAWLVASPLYRGTALVDLALKLVYWMPWILMGSAALLLVRARRRAPGVPSLAHRRLALLALVTLASQLAYSPPRDWVHLIVLYPPTLLLGAALVALVLARRGAGVRLARAAVAVAVGAAVGTAATLAFELRRVHDTPLVTARGTLYGTRVQVEPLQELVDDLAGDRGTPLQALPYHTLVNFLTARPGPSRYYVVWPVDPNGRRDEEVIAGLEAAPDADVLYSPMQVPHYPRPLAYATTLFDYLADHYETVRVYGGDVAGFTFFRATRQPVPAGLPLADAAGGAASVRFVEDAARTQFAEPTTGQVSMRWEPWPFKRTLSVSIDPSGWTEAAFPLDVPPGARFATALALSPDDVGRAFMPAIEFVVLVDDGTVSREALRRTLDPYREHAARGWVPVSVDLAPWAGRRVVLRLRAAKRAGLPGHRDVAGFGDPRIVVAPGS